MVQYCTGQRYKPKELFNIYIYKRAGRGERHRGTASPLNFFFLIKKHTHAHARNKIRFINKVKSVQREAFRLIRLPFCLGIALHSGALD